MIDIKNRNPSKSKNSVDSNNEYIPSLDNNNTKLHEKVNNNHTEDDYLMAEDSIEKFDQTAPESNKRIRLDEPISDSKSIESTGSDNNSNSSLNNSNNSINNNNNNNNNNNINNSKNNITSDTKTLIEENYDENLISICTFCKQKIKQIQWIQHIKKCLTVAMEITQTPIPSTANSGPNDQDRKALMEFQAEISLLKRKISELHPMGGASAQGGYYSGFPNKSPIDNLLYSQSQTMNNTNNQNRPVQPQQQQQPQPQPPPQQPQLINSFNEKVTQSQLDRRRHQDFILDMCMNRPQPSVSAVVVFGDVHVRICHAQHFQHDEFTERFKQSYKSVRDTDLVSPKCYTCKVCKNATNGFYYLTNTIYDHKIYVCGINCIIQSFMTLRLPPQGTPQNQQLPQTLLQDMKPPTTLLSTSPTNTGGNNKPVSTPPFQYHSYTHHIKQSPPTTPQLYQEEIINSPSTKPTQNISPPQSNSKSDEKENKIIDLSS